MDRSPLLQLHLDAGARLADRPEAPGLAAPLTFGNVPEEYGAGREGCALFDAADRGLVRVRGGEAADFLHRLLANQVRQLRPGTVQPNLLLSAKGKVLFEFDLAVGTGEFELSTPPGRAAALCAALEAYHFSEDVSLEDASASHAPLELCGPRAGAVLAAVLGLPALSLDPVAQRLDWSGAPVSLTRAQVAGSPGWRVDAGPQRAAELWHALVAAGARPAGLVARDSLRVEAGVGLWGLDIDENVYPQEARLEPAFALDKGCYIGQEVVAKIDTYGGLNKRLQVLRVDHADPVPRGAQLLGLDEGGVTRELGLVTSWAYSFVLDTGLVLAYVKRRHQEPGTRFDLSGGAGRVELVPLPVRPVSGPRG